MGGTCQSTCCKQEDEQEVHIPVMFKSDNSNRPVSKENPSEHRFPTKFKFDDYWWWFDNRKNPNASGTKPDWVMLEDQESVLMERKYHEFKTNGDRLPKDPKGRFLIDGYHWIDFRPTDYSRWGVMINALDQNDRRMLKRGRKGERGSRPTLSRFPPPKVTSGKF